MESQESPQIITLAEERSNAQSKIQDLQNELTKIDSLIAKEHQRQTNRLKAEHEMWQPLIEDAKPRLKESENTHSVLDELEHLEKEENEARLDIKRQTAQKVEALNTRKSSTTEEITRLKYRIASIWIMIPDVLQEVFRFFVDSGESPWILTHTCRNWRSIALNTASLWSGIIITSNIDAVISRRFNGKEVCNSISRLKAALARVRNARIDLDILIGWYYERIDLDPIEAMLRFVLERSSQWRSLFLLNLEVALPGNHTFPPHFLQRSFPNLESVCLHMQNPIRSRKSRGLVPFIPLLESIMKTSPDLKSIYFDSSQYGLVKRSKLSNPTDHLTLLQSDPRDLQSSYATLLESIPDDPYVRGCLLLVLSEKQSQAVATEDAANRIAIRPGRKLLIHRSVPVGIMGVSVGSLAFLDIIAPAGLQVSSRLELLYLKYLNVYSPTLDGLQYFETNKLDFLQITLIEPRTPRTPQLSGITLADLWASDFTNPKKDRNYSSSFSLKAERVVLDGVTVQPGTLRAILKRMPELLEIHLKNPHLTSISVLSELSTPHYDLDSILIEFKHNLVTPASIESLSEELSKVVSSRKGEVPGKKQRRAKLSKKKWHSVMLQTGGQSIELVERNS